jgi:hypothetical protein
MDEFNNRMDVQRQVLQTVNQQHSWTEELVGLSKKAIERWLHVNQVQSSSEVATTLFQISGKLFFLSSKSQEQVTEEYRSLSLEIQSLQTTLKHALVQYGQIAPV